MVILQQKFLNVYIYAMQMSQSGIFRSIIMYLLLSVYEECIRCIRKFGVYTIWIKLLYMLY